MRRALVSSIAFAAALTGCSVNVEGAKCSVPGSTASCPTGQLCGADMSCSVRAASCMTPPCAVGDIRCQANTTCSVMECSADSDPVCSTWKVAGAGAVSPQTCQIPVGGAAQECACATWTVVPGGGAAACTRPSITSAIAEAVRFASPVVALGGATPAIYGNELDDAAPIVIPAGVTLIGDDGSPAAATNRIIAVRGTATVGLQVQTGAIIRGIAVQRGDLAGPTVGVTLMGGAPASGNTLVSVRVDAGGPGGPFATGLRVAGGNAVAVSDVLVKGTTVAGLEVNRLGATDVVLVSQSTFDGNQVGVSLLKGDLTLAGSTVKGSLAEGVMAAGSAASITIQDGTIAHNLATGLVLTAIDKLVLERTRICGNSGSDRTYGGQTRKVGGIYSLGPKPPQLTFAGNRLHDNVGDQMYVVASTATWDVSGPGSCSTGVPNVFAGYTAPGVGLAALASNVLGLNNAWSASYPTAGVDYVVSGTCGAGACQIDVGTGTGNVCLPVDSTELVCPPP